MAVGTLSGDLVTDLKVDDKDDDALSIADSGVGTSSVVTAATVVSQLQLPLHFRWCKICEIACHPLKIFYFHILLRLLCAPYYMWMYV